MEPKFGVVALLFMLYLLGDTSISWLAERCIDGLMRSVSVVKPAHPDVFLYLLQKEGDVTADGIGDILAVCVVVMCDGDGVV